MKEAESPRVYVSGTFDDIRSAHVRFLQEASKLGPVTVLLRDDRAPPKLGLEERSYFLRALRWVADVEEVARSGPGPGASSGRGAAVFAWTDAVGPSIDGPEAAARSTGASIGVAHRVIEASALAGFPEIEPISRADSASREGTSARQITRDHATEFSVIATGSFDWLHSGHIRFFEEAASYGELTVVVGHDDNIRLLKGAGHPLFPEAERRYLVASIRWVRRALVSTGSGWLDAEPEIRGLRPHRYVVNRDGDKPEKRRYCEEHGIEYIVLERTPREGLPIRSSTALRGF